MTQEIVCKCVADKTWECLCPKLIRLSGGKPFIRVKYISGASQYERCSVQAKKRFANCVDALVSKTCRKGGLYVIVWEMCHKIEFFIVLTLGILFFESNF